MRNETCAHSGWPRLKLAFLSLALLAALRPASAADLVVTQYKISMCSVPWLVAFDEQIFSKAGLDVTGVITGGGGGSVLRNVFANPLPYGEVAVSAVLAAKRQGLDVVIVNTGILSGGEASVVTKPNSDIKTIADLVGKKVAITTARSLSEVTLVMALQAKGLDPKTVPRIAAGGYGQGLTMLDQDVVAAASLLIPLSIISRDKYRTVFSNDEVLKPYVGTVGVTTRAFAKEHPDVIRKIIATRRAGLKAYSADPAKYVSSLAKEFNLEPDVMKEAIATERKFHLVSEGNIDREQLQLIADGLMLVGEIKEPVNWDELIDESFLPDDLKSKR
ncbi:MAG: NitT/TauT family transport system substrate-binding protein [Alphaproteobacteria bacterium]|jgi:NitT/TauT family transport system substrate-binding protein|nr:NitT/TauT family transport system substrate-binding protein [Alphaproteobacteria bacterium]